MQSCKAEAGCEAFGVPATHSAADLLEMLPTKTLMEELVQKPNRQAVAVHNEDKMGIYMTIHKVDHHITVVGLLLLLLPRPSYRQSHAPDKASESG
jgi:hypothetical protein